MRLFAIAVFVVFGFSASAEFDAGGPASLRPAQRGIASSPVIPVSPEMANCLKFFAAAHCAEWLSRSSAPDISDEDLESGRTQLVEIFQNSGDATEREAIRKLLQRINERNPGPREENQTTSGGTRTI